VYVRARMHSCLCVEGGVGEIGMWISDSSCFD